MTTKLFHRDAYQRECETVVTHVRPVEGRGTAVALAETVFYPASGGQAPDRGTLGGYSVVDVKEEEGEVWHHLEAPSRDASAAGTAPPEPGARVTGAIDWDRRFDHMQQHTGQHILSQAFLQTLQAQTLSVHMDQTCTIDLAIAALDPEGVGGAERLANAIVLENRSVTTREVDAQEAAALGLRRPPKQTGLIRMVEVEGFDRSACGGTHVHAAGEVGPIVIRGWERNKGGVRVEFLCGWRALRDYRWTRGLLRDLTMQLTTGEGEMTAAVARLQERIRDLERDLEAVRKVRLEQEAEQLSAAAASAGPKGPAALCVVAAAFAGRSVEDLRALARAVTARPGHVAIFSSEPDRRAVVACSAGVAVDAAAILREAVTAFGGRGGGRPASAEGAAPAAPSAEALVEAARAAAARLLGRSGA
jgi:alanyl-tRNA synthetase